jgi:hypothetical protein
MPSFPEERQTLGVAIPGMRKDSSEDFMEGW